MQHIDGLYENLLEQNLLRIIEPFSTVEISHVSKLIDLPLQKIETKFVSPSPSPTIEWQDANPCLS